LTRRTTADVTGERAAVLAGSPDQRANTWRKIAHPQRENTEVSSPRREYDEVGFGRHYRITSRMASRVVLLTKA
jgi:hypothetical protein